MNTATRSQDAGPAKVRVALEPTGLEPALSDLERTVQANVRRFALSVMRPAGDAMDRMAPEQTIAPESPLWQVFAGVAGLGISVAALMEMPGEERARLLQIIYEELGCGDGGLTVALGAALTPWTALHLVGRQDLVDKYPEGRAIGCWAVTEPDVGTDMLDFDESGLPGHEPEQAELAAEREAKAMAAVFVLALMASGPATGARLRRRRFSSHNPAGPSSIRSPSR